MALLLALALAGTVPPPPPPSGGGTGQKLFAWLPGEVRCGGVTVTATPMRRPLVSLAWGRVDAAPATYGFRIEPGGRTLGVHRLGAAGYLPFGDDVAPSLAATSFAADAPRGECTVTYTPRATPLGETPVEDLIAYTMMPLSGMLPDQGWARIRAGGTCADRPRPEPLVAHYPDYRAIPGVVGAQSWALVGYALDAKGRPGAVHLLADNGNAALDAAGMGAAAASRFTAGSARRGCFSSYRRAPLTLVSPPSPEEDAARPVGATCPARHEWSVRPTLRYPEPYRRRSIEGWAIVTYDVAPWGEIGNARVAVAEPTEEFGTAALAVIRSAKVPTTQGLVGCVDTVRFKLAGDVPAEP